MNIIPNLCSASSDVFDLAAYDLKNVPLVTLRQPGAKAGFKGTRAALPGYKIYVVANEKGVHYVGCTCTRMSSRLTLGNARRKEGKKGYHGYKWLGQESLRLHVFYLPGLVLVEAQRECNRQIAERIEAELVYAVRAATGKWPLSQHEIHFHNLEGEMAPFTTEVAETMFQSLDLPWPLAREGKP